MPGHKHVFEQFPNKYFIETGTFQGETLDMILELGLWQDIRSCDIDTNRTFEYAQKFIPEVIRNDNGGYALSGKFPIHNDEKTLSLKLFNGSTEQVLWSMIKDCNAPATIWLDAHYSGMDTPRSDQNCPLIDELRIIRDHYIKDHTIMIDDIRCCDTDLFQSSYGKITKEMLIKELLAINPNYEISLYNSWEPADIMVARVPS